MVVASVGDSSSSATLDPPTEAIRAEEPQEVSLRLCAAEEVTEAEEINTILDSAADSSISATKRAAEVRMDEVTLLKCKVNRTLALIKYQCHLHGLRNVNNIDLLTQINICIDALKRLQRDPDSKAHLIDYISHTLERFRSAVDEIHMCHVELQHIHDIARNPPF
jgi:hypothetical protein